MFLVFFFLVMLTLTALFGLLLARLVLVVPSRFLTVLTLLPGLTALLALLLYVAHELLLLNKAPQFRVPREFINLCN
jgi:hypothetical protein